MTGDAWGDARLAAAFVDRFDRPAPRELAALTLDRVRATRRRPRWMPDLDRVVVARLAAAAVVIGLLGVIAWTNVDRTPVASLHPSVAPTAIASTSVGSPPPSLDLAAFAPMVAGLPVRSVADATPLAEDSTTGDTELAIAGWYSADDVHLPCPYQPPPPSPIQARCTDPIRAWLGATDDPIIGSGGSEPSAAASDLIRLRILPPVDQPAFGPAADPLSVLTPLPRIVIGHFHDDRSTRCPADERATCDRTFVVDALATATGTLLTAPTYPMPNPPATQMTPADVMSRAQQEIGSGLVLQVGLVYGNPIGWYWGQIDTTCACPRTWLVRGYRRLVVSSVDPRSPGTPVAGWLAIDDDTGAISGTLTEDQPQSSPLPDGFPATVDGLPVRTVAEATAPAGTGALPGEPVAVAGWLNQEPPAPCPSQPNSVCNTNLTVLSGSSDPIISVGAGGVPVERLPAEPVIRPEVLPLGTQPPPRTADGHPLRVVLVLNQGGAPTPGSGGLRGFALDQVAWLEGEVQGPATWSASSARPTRTADQVQQDLLAPLPSDAQTWVVSIGAVRQSELPSVGFLTSQRGYNDQAVVWAVRLVGADPVPGNGWLPGWGSVVVDDASGATSWSWTSP